MDAHRRFRVLGDETRLRILSLLLFQELNVRELVGILQMGQSRVSRHLKLLADAGFLTFRREGLWVYYRAAQAGEARRLLEAVSYLFKEHGPCREDRRRAQQLLRQGKREARRFFDAVAPDWEHLRADILGGVNLAGLIAARIPRCGVAADLGCGSGALLPALAECARRVIGVDASRRMLAEARRRCGGLPGGEVELRLGELEHLPLRDGEVDWGVINLVLHHLRSPLEGLLEAGRAVREQGGLVVVDLDKHDNELLRRRYGDRWLGFADGQIESWMQQAGFHIEERTTLSLEMGLTAVLVRGRKPPAVARAPAADGTTAAATQSRRSDQ